MVSVPYPRTFTKDEESSWKSDYKYDQSMIWYVCLQPYFSSNIVTIGLKIVPPTPIPAIAILIARPRFLANQFVIIILTGISAEFNPEYSNEYRGDIQVNCILSQ